MYVMCDVSKTSQWLPIPRIENMIWFAKEWSSGFNCDRQALIICDRQALIICEEIYYATKSTGG